MIIAFLLLVLTHQSLFYKPSYATSFNNDFKSFYSLFNQPDDVDSGLYDEPSFDQTNLCTRPCDNTVPKTCYWRFTMESHKTLSQACGNCTSKGVCTTPNAPQCITGDGYERSVLVANRRMTGPSIQVCMGDNIIVDVDNRMPGRSTTIHWHGISQKETPYMDGVPMVTQCPILESTVFRYKFEPDAPGTYFWHSHDGFQKMDGVIGSLIVRQPKHLDLNAHLYDYDLPSHVVLVTDWFHNTTSDPRWPGLQYHDEGQLADNYLINGKGSFPGFQAPLAEFKVKPHKRYRFRFIAGTCLACPFQVTIEGHSLTLISMDKSSVEPVTVDTFAAVPGERYDFVIETSRAVSSYWIHVKGLGPCSDRKPYGLAVLRYEGSRYRAPPKPNPGYNGFPYRKIFNEPNNECNPENRTNICISYLNNKDLVSSRILTKKPDMRILMAVGFHDYSIQDFFTENEYNKFFLPIPNTPPVTAYINNISNVLPSSPLLSQYRDIPDDEFCSEECLSNGASSFCNCLNLIKLPKNKLIEIVIADSAGIGLTHPMHLHGYCYYIMAQGILPSGVNFDKAIQSLNRELNSEYHIRPYPPMKDTVPLPSGGYFVVRIFTDNPGFWFFHCHFLYHHQTGMSAVVQVGELSDMVPPPRNFPKCGNFLNDY